LSHRRADAINFGLSGMQELSLCVPRLSCQRSGFLDGLEVIIEVGHNLFNLGG
jgi:hypothetical protein